MSLMEESKKVKRAIEEVADKRIEQQTKECLRTYKAKVVMAANGTTMSVQLTATNATGQPITLDLPYSSSVANSSVGDIVWVATLYNDFRNAFVWQTADWKGAGMVPQPSSTLPKMDGTAAVGSETSYARGDHVHPSDTTKANITGTYKDLISGGVNATQLANNADLNSFYGANYWGKEYFAAGGNSIQNKPSSANGLYLKIARCGYRSTTQIVYNADGTTSEPNKPTQWQRKNEGDTTSGWGDWEEIATSDGTYSNLTAGAITSNQLTTEDLNDIQDSAYWGKRFYGVNGNTVSNKPDGVNAFVLDVYRNGGASSVQSLIQVTDASSNSKCVSYLREEISGKWTAWKEITTADGTYPDMKVGEADTFSKPFIIGYNTGAVQSGYIKFAEVEFTNNYQSASLRFDIVDNNGVNIPRSIAGLEVKLWVDGTIYKNISLLYGEPSALTDIYIEYPNYSTPSVSSPLKIYLYYYVHTHYSTIGIKPFYYTNRSNNEKITYIEDNILEANAPSEHLDQLLTIAKGIKLAICETPATTAAKTVRMSDFNLYVGCAINVYLKEANTAASALTLNINDTGAKTIYINGSATSASNYTLQAGWHLFVYSSYWYTGNKLPINITGSIDGTAASTWDSIKNDRFRVGEATTINSLIAQASDGLLWKVGTGKPCPLPLVAGRANGSYTTATTNATLYTQIRGQSLANMITASNITLADHVKGDPLYLRGSIDDNGYFVCDGNIVTSMAPGYTYVRIGQVDNRSTDEDLYTIDSNGTAITLDDSGQLIAVDGKFIALYNPNLLINGGFEVNQRGLTDYNDNRYSVDGLILRNATLHINDDKSITLMPKQRTTHAVVFEHRCAFDPSRYIGEKFTFSADVSSLSGTQNIYNFCVRFYSNEQYSTIVESKYTSSFSTARSMSLTVTVPSEAKSVSVMLRCPTLNTLTESITLKYIKLELGSVATPYVPRPYAEELALCQRYYQKVHLLAPPMRNTNDEVIVVIPLITPMRDGATVSGDMIDTQSGDNCAWTKKAQYDNCILLEVTNGLTSYAEGDFVINAEL